MAGTIASGLFLPTSPRKLGSVHHLHGPRPARRGGAKVRNQPRRFLFVAPPPRSAGWSGGSRLRPDRDDTCRGALAFFTTLEVPEFFTNLRSTPASGVGASGVMSAFLVMNLRSTPASGVGASGAMASFLVINR